MLSLKLLLKFLKSEERETEYCKDAERLETAGNYK